MRTRAVFIGFIGIISLVSGCKKTIDPNEIPSFLYIDKIQVQAQAGEGTNKQDITDAWVYVGGDAIGVFQLPARIPILAEGNREIWVYGGIKKDGMSSSRIKYPFFEPYITTSINLKRGSVDSLLNPQLSYYPSSSIQIYEESFDDPGFDFQADPLNEGTLSYNSTAAEVYEGSGSGLFQLSSTQSFAKFISSQSFALPKLGKQVYLELHYRTNNVMTLGFQAINGTDISNFDNLHLRSTDGVWKKVYIDFTESISLYETTPQFKFYVKIVKEEGVSTVYNMIDNFKLVYAK